MGRLLTCSAIKNPFVVYIPLLYFIMRITLGNFLFQTLSSALDPYFFSLRFIQLVGYQFYLVFMLFFLEIAESTLSFVNEKIITVESENDFRRIEKILNLIWTVEDFVGLISHKYGLTFGLIEFVNLFVYIVSVTISLRSYIVHKKITVFIISSLAAWNFNLLVVFLLCFKSNCLVNQVSLV